MDKNQSSSTGKGLSVYATFVALGIVLSLGFQNCKIAGDRDNKVNKSSLGNGDGYGGKGTYVNYDLSGKCGGSGIEVESRVEYIGGKPYLTRENCQDILAKAADDMTVAEHNSDIGLKSKMMFEDATLPGITDVFCRADHYDEIEQQREVADVYVREESENNFFAYVKIGIYKNGILAQHRELTRIEVVKNDLNIGMTTYFQLPEGGTETFSLHFDFSQLLGFMHVIELPAPPTGTPSPEPLPPLAFDTNPSDDIHIENIECFTHDSN